jgi:hypothetical protein
VGPTLYREDLVAERNGVGGREGLPVAELEMLRRPVNVSALDANDQFIAGAFMAGDGAVELEIPAGAPPVAKILIERAPA